MSERDSHSRALGPPSILLASFGLAASAYLNVLALVSNRTSGNTPCSRNERVPAILAVVPAHDEERGIAAAVASLQASGYESLEIVVVADNCSDATAERARAAGAEVWERTDPDRPGKGPVLAWAFERAAARAQQPDALMVFDADCRIEPGALQAIAARLAAGAPAVQARYAIGDPESSEAAALRAAAFTLMNDVRPRGKSALGLSAGLLGTGMVFARATLDAVPWDAFSVTEDREYHLRLVEAGLPVSFVPEALVTTPAAAGAQGADTQERRWDAGNVELARRWLPRVLGDRRMRGAERVVTVADLVCPPQALLTAVWVTALAGGLLGRSRAATRLAAFAGAGQATYVVAGLKSAGAPPAVWRALPRAPRLVARRLVQLVGVVREPPQEWERTERDG